METGIIKQIDYNQGLGYVMDPEGHEIVLITLGLEKELEEGAPVTYNIRQTRVGIIAVDVHAVHPATPGINGTAHAA